VTANETIGNFQLSFLFLGIPNPKTSYDVWKYWPCNSSYIVLLNTKAFISCHQ